MILIGPGPITEVKPAAQNGLEDRYVPTGSHGLPDGSNLFLNCISSHFV
jgi:hypothetical protein